MKQSTLGRWGEQAVAEWLKHQGFTLLARNWGRGEGEVDLVAMQGGTLVVFGVTAWRSAGFGTPVERGAGRSHDQRARLAQRYLDENPALSFNECRFDVVVVDLTGNRPRIRHYPNAFLPIG